MARLQTAVLCSAASVEQSGLVSMLGAFIDTITGRGEMPVRYQLWFVARLLFDEADVGVGQEIEIVVDPLEPEGEELPQTVRPLARVQGEVRAEPTSGLDPRQTGGGLIVVPLALEFDRLGLYHVTFSLNGDLLWDAPLVVKLATPPA